VGEYRVLTYFNAGLRAVDVSDSAAAERDRLLRAGTPDGQDAIQSNDIGADGTGGSTSSIAPGPACTFSNTPANGPWISGFRVASAIVTGASRGIGNACAAELVAEARTVVVVSRDALGNAAACITLIAPCQGCVIGTPADLNDPAACRLCLPHMTDFGRLDILVNWPP